MLKISVKVRASCKKHPRYDPSKDGRGGIRGECSGCIDLLEFYDRICALKDRISELEGGSTLIVRRPHRAGKAKAAGA